MGYSRQEYSSVLPFPSPGDLPNPETDPGSPVLQADSLLSEPPTAAAAKSFQSCLTLCDPIDGSPPGSPVPEILQARTLEWGAIAFSNAWKWKVKSLSRVLLLVTPWTAAYQAPPSIHGIFQARVLEWGAIAFTKEGPKYELICLIITKYKIMDICCLLSLSFSFLVSITYVLLLLFITHKNNIEKIIHLSSKYDTNRPCNSNKNILNNLIHLPNLQNCLFLLTMVWCLAHL